MGSYLAGYFTAKVLAVIIFTASGGLMFGYTIGFVSTYSTLDSENQDCPKFKTEVACTSLKHAKCVWSAEKDACIFKDIDCSLYSQSKHVCEQSSSSCYYNYDDNRCEHFTGMTPSKLGIYASGMTIGGVIGSFTGGPYTRIVGRRLTLITAGCTGLLGIIILHLARIWYVYALSIVGRIIQGIAAGVCCVVCPMYVDELAPSEYARPLGNLYQVSLTFGIMLDAFVAYVFCEQRDKHVKQNNEVRIHMLMFVQDLLCVLVIVVGYFCKESPMFLRLRAQSIRNAQGGKSIVLDEQQSITAPLDAGEKGPTDENIIATEGTEMHNDGAEGREERKAQATESAPAAKEDQEDADIEEYTICSLLLELLTSFIVCIALQLTGINGIMNYAPQMVNELGVQKLLGNMLIMIWNFLGTVFSIPLASYFTFRNLYVWGVLGGGIANIIVAVPTYPKVASENTRNGVALFGIFAFIGVFEMTFGPSFFPVNLQLFPHSFRSKGAAFGQASQMFFNLIMNAFYPIAVQGISGGPSENQKKGMSIVFFIFAAISFISFVYLWRFLVPFYPYEDDSVAAAEEKEKAEEETAPHPQFIERDNADAAEEPETRVEDEPRRDN